MNILSINTTDRKGGAAEVSWGIKTGLEKRGYAVNMFVGRKYSKNESVIEIPRKRFFDRLSHYLSTDIDFFMSDKILETKEFKESDLTHLHNLHGNYFKLSTLKKISEKMPVVWTFHDMWPITPCCAHAMDGKVEDGFFECSGLYNYPKLLWNNKAYLRWKKKNIYQKSNFSIVVPSLWLKEKVSQSILSGKPIYHIPNGIDTSVFLKRDKPACRNKHNLPQDKKIVIFVASGGKDNTLKGWEYFEYVAEHLKNKNDCLFICIGGNGPEGKILNNVVYLPYIEDKNILSEYLSGADIFLFTSLAENFPLVILEAMGTGLPIVTFDVGGAKEAVVHKENGYVAEYKNTGDLICGVEYILSLSDEEIEKMSERSAQRVREQFSLKIMTDKYIELYKSIVKNEK